MFSIFMYMYTYKEHVDVHATLIKIRATISDLRYAYLSTRFIATGAPKSKIVQNMEKMTESDLEN